MSKAKKEIKDGVRALILCAGKSQRMKSGVSKVLHPLGGLPLLGHVLRTVKMASIDHVALVVSPDFQDEGAYTSFYPHYVQVSPQGTAHAVQSGRDFFKNKGMGTLLVLYGDTPLLSEQTLKKILDRHKEQEAAITVLGMEVTHPHSYGRLVINTQGLCEKIIEAQEASLEEQKITLCNSGVMAFDQEKLELLLDQIKNTNEKGEFYLTDAVHLARAQGWKVAVEIAPEKELVGINTRQDLAHAEEIFQETRREELMDHGVTMRDPASVRVSFDTQIEADVVIEPHVIMGPGVHIQKGASIRGFSYLEGCHIGSHARVGPFARIRPGTKIASHAQVGNFVEIKKSIIGDGTKINHLSYIGDATLGSNVNVGAGTITCNYDGVHKHPTAIGDQTFIGANTAIVAPVSIGDDCLIGAGSVITKNVDSGTLALSRSPQKAFPRAARKMTQTAHKESKPKEN